MDATTNSPAPRGHRIHLGPERPDALADAVTGAGATLTSAEEADGVVWYGGSKEDLAGVLTPRTRWVQLPAAGVESWVQAGLIRDGIVFTSAAGAYAPTVAEHTLALMLAGTRRLHELARARSWSRPTPSTLRGATVAVIGAGGIGASLIELLQPLGARVVAVTRSGRTVAGAAESVGPDRLDSVLAEADHVVLAAPATTDTRHLIGARELALMKPTSWLVNIARGSLVDTDALVDALREGRIGGAALDVTDPEPLPPDHPLWMLPGVLVSPHVGGNTSAFLPRARRLVADQLRRFAAGEPLVSVVSR
jgi:phosphoglycerate dehydrogenase-like enzyme